LLAYLTIILSLFCADYFTVAFPTIYEQADEKKAAAAAQPATANAPPVVKPAFGHIRVTLQSAKGLYNSKCCGDQVRVAASVEHVCPLLTSVHISLPPPSVHLQDIGVRFILGNHMEASPVARDGGTSPAWKSQPSFALYVCWIHCFTL